ncbi:type II/IV secretion system ATPase subunit [Candidatus Pyrohabitans sp.]
MRENPHLRKYVREFVGRGNEMPGFHFKLTKELASDEYPNLIYLAGVPVFIHIYRPPRGGETEYIAIEPKLTGKEKEKYMQILDSLLIFAQHASMPKDEEELKELIDKALKEVGVREQKRFELGLIKKVPLSEEEFHAIRYQLIRDIIGMGMLEPFSRDPYIEDIFASGLGPIFVVHKFFGNLKTNIVLKSDQDVDEYCFRTGERMDAAISDATPIVDGTMPDGSRVSIVYSRAISRRGSSFSVRKQTSEPLSITRIVDYGTIDSEIAAYLWIAIENGMNVFFCGESACGKTSLLNAACAFIEPTAKVYTAEDTIEVTVPHKCWQQLTTVLGGLKGSYLVSMHDLLIASLRSRPNYIIVGEIRGSEGAIAFQAMQTGHPVMSTFHASSVKKMIQRLTGNPINVPITFIDNLNVGVIMRSVYRGRALLRRVVEISEIEGYSSEAQGVLTRRIFDWDPVKDVHLFKGMYNSFILENKIAPTLGYEDKREIYKDLALRRRIIDEMVRRNIFDYYEVYEIIKSFWRYGAEGLPFPV